MKLRRVAIGPVKLDKLPRGKARRVSESELADLKKFVAASKEKIEKARDRAAGKKPGDSDI
jgi:23S rRNA pseudouridine2605 synthase